MEKMMKVTSKGQVTIPLTLREKYGITENTEITFMEDKNRIVIVKSKTARPPERFRKQRGTATVGMTTDEIMALTRG